VSHDLDGVVEALDRTGWSCLLTGPDWRIVWSSPQLSLILQQPADDLAVGRHLLDPDALSAFSVITEESLLDWVRLHAPFALHDGPDSREDLAALVDERARPIVEAAEPAAPPPRWFIHMKTGGDDDVGVNALGERLVAEDGTLLGNVWVYGSSLPASVLWFVGQGDQRMFSRLADLIEPARRPAAVLFADVEGSTDLSRRVSSAAYFDLIRRLTATVDAAILDADGVIGKHAGDGVSAFFLEEQVGSGPAAALAAVRAAREIVRRAPDVDPRFRMKVAIHWGATLFIGRVATTGRLEVTALGDEVNECARIQDAAGGGELLATKALIERLDPEEARGAGLDPETLEYALVAELPEAGEKALRDAGSIAVTRL
jgi:class 3 adenylate cyclase